MKSTKLSSFCISIPVVSGALQGGCLTNKNIKTAAAEDRSNFTQEDCFFPESQTHSLKMLRHEATHSNCPKCEV